MLHLGDLITLPVIAVRSVRGGDGAEWPAHEVIGGKPRKQFLGPSGSDLGLSLYLHVTYISPRPTLTRLRQISASGEAFQLWTDSGGMWGTYVIEKVDHSVRWTLPSGQMIAIAVELTLSDPGLEGALELVRPLAIAGNAVGTTVTLPPEDTSQPASEITPQEIARI